VWHRGKHFTVDNAELRRENKTSGRDLGVLGDKTSLEKLAETR
jgi:hypothetical protein